MTGAVRADPRQLSILAGELRAAGREVSAHGPWARRAAKLPPGAGEFTAAAAADRFTVATWRQQADLHDSAGSVERTAFLFELADGDLRGGFGWIFSHMRDAVVGPGTLWDLMTTGVDLTGRRLLVNEARRLLAAGKSIGGVTERMRVFKGSGTALGGLIGAVLSIPDGLSEARRQEIADRSRHDLSHTQREARNWLSGSVPIVAGAAGGAVGTAVTGALLTTGVAAAVVAGAPVVAVVAVGAAAVVAGAAVGYGATKAVEALGHKLRDFSFKKIHLFGGR